MAFHSFLLCCCTPFFCRASTSSKGKVHGDSKAKSIILQIRGLYDKVGHVKMLTVVKMVCTEMNRLASSSANIIDMNPYLFSIVFCLCYSSIICY